LAFKDHFSRQSADYAKYRPSYPDELFDWLASLTAAHDLAWDVGTGSGQAALGLARHFQHVIASDAAEAQLRNAAAHERISYKVMPAEQSDIADASVDLITVAQALHWFDFDRFYREAVRVLKPDGVIAAWTYGLNEISPEVDAILRHYYSEIVGPYWLPERRHIDAHYRTIPFPFSEIPASSFRMEMRWNLDELLGYLGTWSVGQRYQQVYGHDPLDRIRESLARVWGSVREARGVSWPIYLRVGRR
jgi:SAM-dependent methyltransferase